METRTHIVGPGEGLEHTHTVIFLHGKGSDCNEFASEFFESEASEPSGKPRTLPDLFPTVRWVFPSAPELRSKRFESVESQWFDMWSVENPEEHVEMQLEGLEMSIDLIRDIIVKEEALLSRGSIFLGGISQGFATAVSTFCVDGYGFAGLIGLCSWMPAGALEKLYPNEQGRATPQMCKTPIFLGHSSDDNVVPVQNGRQLRSHLSALLGCKVEWHEYEDGGHWINEPQGVDDIVAFLKLHIGRNRSVT